MIPSQLVDDSSDECVFPRRLGRYVLVCHLGEGGMGRVYLALARSGKKEELLVIKRFGNPRSHFTQQQIDENKQRFRREAQITLALAHPCIARTYLSVEQDSRSYLVQEFVHGMTLEYLNMSLAGNGEHFPVPVATYTVAEIARALEYLHDFRGLGLIHRDLTPSNVMLSDRGEVKVIDFGIAKATEIADGVTKPYVLIGKPIWTAPEVIEGRKPDRRADLYALGLLFWTLLTGRLPEQRPPGAARVPPPSAFNRDLDEALDRLVVTAVDKDPDRRFQTARQFLEALAPFLRTTGQGAKDLLTLVARYQPVLERKFLAEVVGRGRPLLDEAGPKPGHGKRALLVLPILAVIGLGIILTVNARPPAQPEQPMNATKPMPSLREPEMASGAVSRTTPLSPASDVPSTKTIQRRPTLRRSAKLGRPSPPAVGPTSATEEAPPTSAEDMLDAAMEALSRGESDKALALARASGHAHPAPEPYILIGRALFEKDPAAAAAALETAVRISPGNREASHLLGALKQRMVEGHSP